MPFKKLNKQIKQKSNRAVNQVKKIVNQAINAVQAPVVGGNRPHPNDNKAIPPASSNVPTTFK